MPWSIVDMMSESRKLIPVDSLNICSRVDIIHALALRSYNIWFSYTSFSIAEVYGVCFCIWWSLVQSETTGAVLLGTSGPTTAPSSVPVHTWNIVLIPFCTPSTSLISNIGIIFCHLQNQVKSSEVYCFNSSMKLHRIIQQSLHGMVPWLSSVVLLFLHLSLTRRAVTRQFERSVCRSQTFLSSFSSLFYNSRWPFIFACHQIYYIHVSSFQRALPTTDGSLAVLR